MLYYLFDYLEKQFDLIGAGVFQYISFRAGMAAFVSLLITITYGQKLIAYLRRKQVGEDIRDLGLNGQVEKKGTPTMGGLIIIAAILIPSLLFARLDNIYIVLLIISTLWLGTIGFLDDYIKVFKKDKKGLAGKFKIVGQVGLGIIVGLTLYFNENVVIRQVNPRSVASIEEVALQDNLEDKIDFKDTRSTKTTLPFVKNNELDYGKIFPFVPRE